MPDIAQDDAPLAPAAMVAPAPVEGIDTPDVATGDKALVVVGNHRFTKDGKRLVIVTEAYTFDKDGKATLKTDGYPKGADVYYRTDPAVTFPDDAAEVVTLGVDVEQLNFWGFSPDPRYLNVGPASPAFGAANLAAQRGATEIEIVGLTDGEKERLAPFFAALPTDVIAPSTATITVS